MSLPYPSFKAKSDIISTFNGGGLEWPFYVISATCKNLLRQTMEKQEQTSLPTRSYPFLFGIEFCLTNWQIPVLACSFEQGLDCKNLSIFLNGGVDCTAIIHCSSKSCPLFVNVSLLETLFLTASSKLQLCAY